jgi:hypothetical protein
VERQIDGRLDPFAERPIFTVTDDADNLDVALEGA